MSGSEGANLTDPMLRAVIGQARSSFDFRWMMDNRKILLCDFSKGSIGEDNAQLLGSLVVIKEKLAALSRHDVPEEERVPHVLYTEEAQNFIGDFPSILQEARKYRLILVLATQGIEQLSEDAASAVFTNCATLASFRVSGADAARLMKEFATPLPAASLQDLEDYKIFVRTLTTLGPEGPSSPSGPFCVKAYPPLPKESCWYGFMVQRDLAGKAQGLSERLKVAAERPDFVNNYSQLVSLVREFAQDVTPFAVAPQHSHALAFCYLVNSGATCTHVLRGFQEMEESGTN